MRLHEVRDSASMSCEKFHVFKSHSCVTIHFFLSPDEEMGDASMAARGEIGDLARPASVFHVCACMSERARSAREAKKSRFLSATPDQKFRAWPAVETEIPRPAGIYLSERTGSRKLRACRDRLLSLTLAARCVRVVASIDREGSVLVRWSFFGISLPRQTHPF